MELFNNKICVTFEELTGNADGEPIMTKSVYRHSVERKTVNLVRRACFGRQALVEYATLPEKYRKRYEARYGDPEKILKEDRYSIAINEDARDYFAQAAFPNGERLSEKQIEEYTINASVLDALIDILNEQRDGRKQSGMRTAIDWDGICGISERIRKDVGHTLPESEFRLREKMYQYSDEGYECLISQNVCIRKAQKITEKGGRFIVAMQRSQVEKYSLSEILKAYNLEAEKAGWKPLKSASTIKKYLDRPEVMRLWYGARYGELAAKQKFDRKHRTQMPTMRDALWYGDGTKLNLYYMGRNRKGERAKCTISVYEVIDAYSEMLLGYCISPVENFDAQRKAFRMAVETAGHRPYEIVTDNQGGQNKLEAKRFMAKICRVSRRTQSHNPQSKSIEQVFGRFQSQVLKKKWFFTGQNITAVSKESRPNMEFIEANDDKLYTFEEMCAVYAECREIWNDMPHPRTGKSRREMYYASQNPEAPELSEYSYMDMFWEQTEAAFTASGIEIRIDNIPYAYEVFDGNGDIDYDFRKENTGRRFVVRYDPDDMSKVWLCSRTSVGLRRVCEAYPYAMIHRAAQEQTLEEQQFIRDTVEANKRIRIERQLDGYALDMEHGVAPEQHGLRTPKLQGISRAAIERLSDRYVAQTSIEGDEPAGMTCEPIVIGQVNKVLSNMTFDKLQLYNKY